MTDSRGCKRRTQNAEVKGAAARTGGIGCQDHSAPFAANAGKDCAGYRTLSQIISSAGSRTSGVREGRLVFDQRDCNLITGAEFVVPALGNPRFAAFTLPAPSRAEVTDAHRDLVRRLGAARYALRIPGTGDARVETNRRAIWGAVNQPREKAEATPGSYRLLNWAFRIVERL